MLLPIEVNSISKQKGYKQNFILLSGFCDGKIIFILLAKVIALDMGPTIGDIRNLSLEFISQRSTF